MTYRGKNTRVFLSKDAQKQYDELKVVVERELKEEITKSFNQQLLKSIDNKIAYLKMNPVAGDHAQKPLPKELVSIYDINNLWIIDLVGYWRMFYTLKPNEVEIIALILEWMDHDKYNKMFGRKGN
ncbi:MAG: hypothetical protein V1870_01080 [Candidatus Aenigmatarchaeota archaeon]